MTQPTESEEKDGIGTVDIHGDDSNKHGRTDLIGSVGKPLATPAPGEEYTETEKEILRQQLREGFASAKEAYERNAASPDNAKEGEKDGHSVPSDSHGAADLHSDDGDIPLTPDNAKLVERLRALKIRTLFNEDMGVWDCDPLPQEAATALEALQARIAELENDIMRYAYSPREKEVTALRARITELEKERDELFLNNGWAANYIAELERDRDIWRKKAGG